MLLTKYVTRLAEFERTFRLCLVHVKYFPEMLFSGKENIFKCLVAFQKNFWKIFSNVWLCSWKYHRKHIFYLLLTFSQLPNKYIISFIPQYRNTNKTQKKISSNPVKLREEGRERGDWVWREARSHGVVLRLRLARRRDRDRREGEITIGAVLRRSDPIQKGEGDRERERSTARTQRHDLAIASKVGPLCLWVVLSLSLSPFARLWAPLFARLSSGSDIKVK